MDCPYRSAEEVRGQLQLSLFCVCLLFNVDRGLFWEGLQQLSLVCNCSQNQQQTDVFQECATLKELWSEDHLWDVYVKLVTSQQLPVTRDGGVHLKTYIKSPLISKLFEDNGAWNKTMLTKNWNIKVPKTVLVIQSNYSLQGQAPFNQHICICPLIQAKLTFPF